LNQFSAGKINQMINKLYSKMKDTASRKHMVKGSEEYPSFFKIILFVLFGNR